MKCPLYGRLGQRTWSMSFYPNAADGAGNENSGSPYCGRSANRSPGGKRPRFWASVTGRCAAIACGMNWGCVYDGLLDRRRCRPTTKRVPLETVEQVLMLYRERVFRSSTYGTSTRSWWRSTSIGLSYTWVKSLLQGAGLVAKSRKRGAHRKRRQRRPVAGHVVAHRWQPAPLVSGRALV